MTVFAILMAVVWLAGGALSLWLGMKSSQGTLPKNKWIGIRTPEMMASDEAWVTGHKAAAPLFMAAALPLLIGGVMCFFVEDAVISWISIPVVVLLLVLVFLASKKASDAVGK